MKNFFLFLAFFLLSVSFVFANEDKNRNHNYGGKKISKEECARYEFRDVEETKNGFKMKIFKDGVNIEDTFLESSEKSREIYNDLNEVSTQCDIIKGESEKMKKQRHEKRNKK
jgi:hypothetical protein